MTFTFGLWLIMTLTFLQRTASALSSTAFPFKVGHLRQAVHVRLMSYLQNSEDVVTKNNDKKSEEKTKHEIRWRTSDDSQDVVFHANHGETLRTAALRRGLVSPHNGRARLINCRGLGTCGTCAVELDPSASIEPQERNRIEQIRLNAPPHGRNQKLRLACQVQIHGDVVVTKRSGFWGQCESLAQPSSAETYFGDWEFILDRKSPPET